MKSWIKEWLFRPIDRGVKTLAQRLRIVAFHIYEMLSRMEPSESREFLEKLNDYHSDDDRLRQAAIPFIVFKLKAPNSDLGEQRVWQNRFEMVRVEWNITDEDLEISVKFIPYFSCR